MSRTWSYTSIILFLVVSGVVGLNGRYDRDVCLNLTQNNYTEFFSHNPDYFCSGQLPIILYLHWKDARRCAVTNGVHTPMTARD
jgi:hypothetical protein